MLDRIDENLWSDAYPLIFMKVLHFGARMSLVRLSDGSLFVFSPIPLTDERKAAVDALGPVKHIVAPNLFHHLSAGHWKEAYPDATLYVTEGLLKKRKDLKPDVVLTPDAGVDWPQELGHLRLRGMPALNENVFHHRPTRTLLCCDLIQYMKVSPHWMTRMYQKLGGFDGKPGFSKLLKSTVRDRAALRECVDEILAWDFDRVIPGHLEILESGGKEAVERIWSWL